MKQTKLYAEQKKIQHRQDVTIDKQALISILIGMGLHDKPATEMFWSSDTLFSVKPIADIIIIVIEKLYKKYTKYIFKKKEKNTSKTQESEHTS